MAVKYQLNRWRNRMGTTSKDRGPEGGWFRYEIKLKVLDTEEECFKMVSKLEGDPIDEVRKVFNYCGFYYGNYKPTGYVGLYSDGSTCPEWYNDEYHIQET